MKCAAMNQQMILPLGVCGYPIYPEEAPSGIKNISIWARVPQCGQQERGNAEPEADASLGKAQANHQCRRKYKDVQERRVYVKGQRNPDQRSQGCAKKDGQEDIEPPPSLVSM